MTISSERRNRVLGRSQVDLLLAHLKRGRSISPAEARVVYGIERLAARIMDLRNRGVRIVSVERIDAKGARYTRYRLAR